MKPMAILAVLLFSSGCTAVGAVADLATMPVRGASKAVDVATVSQSERDERRGREMRQREERIGELDREYRRQSLACADGDAQACTRRDAAYREMQTLLPGEPE